MTGGRRAATNDPPRPVLILLQQTSSWHAYGVTHPTLSQYTVSRGLVHDLYRNVDMELLEIFFLTFCILLIYGVENLYCSFQDCSF